MNTYNVFLSALVIVIGLESLYSSALEMPWEYEFPFKLPFASHDIIHRSFPIRIKYTKETKQPENASIQREWSLSEPATSNVNKVENKQLEELEPKVDMKKQPEERMDNKDSYKETLKQNSDNYRQKAMAKTPDSKSSDAPGSYNTQHIVNGFHEKALDNDADEDDSEENNSEEDNSKGNSEEEEDEEDAGKGSRSHQQKIEEPIKNKVPKFPYRLFIQVMNPKGQVFHKMKTGYVSELQLQLFKKDNIFYFLRSLRDKKGRKEEREDFGDLKRNEKQEDEVSHPEYIFAPVLRHSSQVMDKKGNLYRQEKNVAIPILLAKFLEKKFKVDAQKSINDDKEARKIGPSKKDDEESKEKSVTGNEKFLGSKSVDDSINVNNPARKSYWQEKAQKKEIDKPLKVVNLNTKLDEVDRKSYFKLESSIAKDDEDEKEKLQKVVIIRPLPRVFHASVDIIPPEKSEEEPKKMEPTVMNEEPQKLPGLKGAATKYLFISGPTKFSLNHILDPLRHLLNMKILGHTSRVDAQQ